MQLTIKTDLKKLPSVIDFNYEEIKKELAGQLKKYQGVVFTEETMKDGKADRAKLNKLGDALNEEKKRIKNICLEPYNGFEQKIKELMGMVEAPKNAIDAQIKEYENGKREEKTEAIRELYEKHAGEYADIVSLDAIFDNKWLNATASLKSIESEIKKRFTTVKGDLTVIDGWDSASRDIVRDKYLETLDLGTAMAEGKAYEQRQKALANVKAAQEEREVTAGLEAYNKAVVHSGKSAADVVDVPYEEVPEDTKTIKVVFYDTTTAFRADMKALTEKHGIKYGGIK